jgi:hypothetical protein
MEITMSYTTNATQHPLILGFSAYACAHVMLFSLIGMLALPFPAIWWAGLALVPSWLLMRWLKRFDRADLAQLVGVSAAAFAGGVIGIHGRELFCLFRALI